MQAKNQKQEERWRKREKDCKREKMIKEMKLNVCHKSYAKDELSSRIKTLMRSVRRNRLMIVIDLDLPPCYVHGYLLV